MKKQITTEFAQGLVLALMVGFILGFSPVFLSSSQVFADGTDDFSYADSGGDPAKWGKDERKGRGQLFQANGRLEYITAGIGTRLDSSDRPWKLTRFPSDSDWFIQITATNTTSPDPQREWSSFGINIESLKDRNDSIEVELAAAAMVWAELHNNGQYLDGAGTVANSYSVPIRLSYISSTKVFTVAYWNGATWIDFGSFGVNGSGGSINADWDITDSDQFIAYVFGYSENMTIDNGQLYGDDFLETGGMVPPLPEITNPPDDTSFDACSYFAPPLFQWVLPNTFQKLELQFYTSANPTKPMRVKIKDTTTTQLQMPANTWKKILKLPGLSGGEINYKIVGTNKGESPVESNIYTMTIAAPEQAENPQISTPVSQSSEPTLSWGNACATKFKVHFSPDMPEAKEKKLTFTDQNPVDNGETFTTTLTEGTWNAIRKLVDDVIGSRMCFYVESWDILKRYQKTDWVCFDLEP